MEDLVLYKEDSLEDNILKIIDFVKQVERENGLTDKQIEIKYTSQHCYALAYEFVVKTLRNILDVSEEELNIKMGYVKTKIIVHHWYIELKQNKGKPVYFDILGKKTFEEKEKFLQSDYWDKLHEDPFIEDFKTTYSFSYTGYVLDAIKQHVTTNNLTV